MFCVEMLPVVLVGWEEKLAVWILLAAIAADLGLVYCGAGRFE